MKTQGPVKIGTATMAADGTLTIHTDASPPGAQEQTYKPADPAYAATVQMIGGIAKGQTKTLYESAGEVTMNADGSISYSLAAYSPSGEQFRQAGDAKPGTVNYETLVKRVGGLKPGETKPIPVQ